MTAANSFNPELQKAAMDEIEQLKDQLKDVNGTVLAMAQRHQESMDKAHERFIQMFESAQKALGKSPTIFQSLAGGVGRAMGAAAAHFEKGFRA